MERSGHLPGPPHPPLTHPLPPSPTLSLSLPLFPSVSRPPFPPPPLPFFFFSELLNAEFLFYVQRGLTRKRQKFNERLERMHPQPSPAQPPPPPTPPLSFSCFWLRQCSFSPAREQARHRCNSCFSCLAWGNKKKNKNQVAAGT